MKDSGFDDDDDEVPEEVSTVAKDPIVAIESHKSSSRSQASVAKRLEKVKRKRNVEEDDEEEAVVVVPEPIRREKVVEGVWRVKDTKPMSLFDIPPSKSALEFKARRLGTVPRDNSDLPLSKPLF